MSSLDAVEQVSSPRRGAREEPECAVDVEPGAVTLGEVGEIGDRIEVPRVHFARVSDQDRRRAVEPLQLLLHPREVQVARGVGRADGRSCAAKPEHSERLEGTDVDEAAREDWDLRQRCEAFLLDVDAAAARAPPSRGREAGEVGHRPAGHEHARPGAREAE